MSFYILFYVCTAVLPPYINDNVSQDNHRLPDITPMPMNYL